MLGACRLSRVLAEEAGPAWLWGSLRLSEPGCPAWACLGLLWAKSCLSGGEEVMLRGPGMGFAGILPSWLSAELMAQQSSCPSVGANACARGGEAALLPETL